MKIEKNKLFQFFINLITYNITDDEYYKEELIDDYWITNCKKCSTPSSHEYCSDCYNLGYDKEN